MNVTFIVMLSCGTVTSVTPCHTPLKFVSITNLIGLDMEWSLKNRLNCKTLLCCTYFLVKFLNLNCTDCVARLIIPQKMWCDLPEPDNYVVCPGTWGQCPVSAHLATTEAEMGHWSAGHSPAQSGTGWCQENIWELQSLSPFRVGGVGAHMKKTVQIFNFGIYFMCFIGWFRFRKN